MNKRPTPFQSAARDFAAAFTTDNPRKVWAIHNNAPAWMREAMHAVHADRFPDDWIYATAKAAADYIAEAKYTDADDAHDQGMGCFADDNVDVYNAARSAWLASNLNNADYCDRAVSDGLVAADADMFDRIGVGQYLASEEIYAGIIDAIQTEAEVRREAFAEQITEIATWCVER